MHWTVYLSGEIDKRTLEELRFTTTFLRVFFTEDTVFVCGVEAEGVRFVVHGAVGYAQKKPRRRSHRKLNSE